ncbi:Zn-dependent protease [Motilibacter rhizosphaerae]|uniref:Zn-dependent protease n=1 Tax=Motilibacter rhizosphaerae TaxID=598652 RepID=A0A4Q7NAU1_9ACTN|nr:Zn-dependent protease [Motilibacter rhizosphaerae]
MPGLRVARVGGVPVVLRAPVLAGVVVVAWVFAPLAARLGGVPRDARSYLAGAAYAVLVLACVLAHEAAHACAARRAGLPVAAVEVGALHGGTRVLGEPGDPRGEALVAAAGPAASLVLAALASAALLQPPGPGRLLAAELVLTNLLLGLVNLLPGLPLDGGRLLLALLWSRGRSRADAAALAAWSGIGLAGAAVLVALAAAAARRVPLAAAGAGALAAALLAAGAARSLGTLPAAVQRGAPADDPDQPDEPDQPDQHRRTST